MSWGWYWGKANWPMYQNHTIAVVVPAYNEEALIACVIETMPEYAVS